MFLWWRVFFLLDGLFFWTHSKPQMVVEFQNLLEIEFYRYVRIVAKEIKVFHFCLLACIFLSCRRVSIHASDSTDMKLHFLIVTCTRQSLAGKNFTDQCAHNVTIWSTKILSLAGLSKDFDGINDVKHLLVVTDTESLISLLR